MDLWGGGGFLVEGNCEDRGHRGIDVQLKPPKNKIEQQ